MIQIIHPSTPEQWENYYHLRWSTLRQPWNQPKGSEKDDIEEKCIHFFAVDDQKPLGVCRLQYNNDSVAQVRFVGVSENARGKGIGKMMMQEAERTAKDAGRSELILQARDTAVDFYLGIGYEIAEKSHVVFGIQHYLMKKFL